MLAEFLAGCEVLLGRVRGGVLGGLDDAGRLRFMQKFEAGRNRLVGVDHGVVDVVRRSGLAEVLSARSSAGVLVEALRISPREARRRVDAADALVAAVHDRAAVPAEASGVG